mmetsp:Transcript_49713/g.50545  ORF Transcript_49713/g.50545 Transcript_49713/m.50545 type:complete len:123 (-) Transcript_49713:49-417(-)
MCCSFSVMNNDEDREDDENLETSQSVSDSKYEYYHPQQQYRSFLPHHRHHHHGRRSNIQVVLPSLTDDLSVCCINYDVSKSRQQKTGSFLYGLVFSIHLKELQFVGTVHRFIITFVIQYNQL